jgi:hypothetical protein
LILTPKPKLPYRYLYHQGYYAQQEDIPWIKFSMTGSGKISTVWFPKKAAAFLSVPDQSKTSGVLGYLRRYTGSQWCLQ